ncbi:LINE-1 retrotransposable element ORF2 protein [Varanus komodoensis]|nr:LINE-1 retrotransposable element ORF2 protein [Varanus komodoensis]
MDVTTYHPEEGEIAITDQQEDEQAPEPKDKRKEVLNRNIKEDMDIKGARIRDESYKLQAFADDLVFILEKPLVTMSKLLQKIEEYGEVTGMKINREKTKLLVKNLTVEQRKTLMEQVDLQIVKKEAKGNGGFGLPDWMLYYQASVLTWLKEWIPLRNKRILYLEGHDLQMGWHAYMWYEKCKAHGIVPDDVGNQAMYLILHVTTATRIALAQHWKSEEPPTNELILKKILDCAEMGRLTLSLKEKEDTDFYQTWNSFYYWLEKRDYA